MEQHTFRQSQDPLTPDICATCGKTKMHKYHNPVALSPQGQTAFDASVARVTQFTQGFTTTQKLIDEDPINPSHYTYSKISALDCVEEWELNFCLGQVIKYIQRHKRKGFPLQDLKKAQWYLAREITRMEASDGPKTA